MEDNGPTATGTSTTTNALFDSPPKYWMLVRDSSAGTTQFYKNGTTDGSAATIPETTLPDTAEPIKIGNNWLGEFYEIIYYNRVLTTAELTEISDHLTSKWGL